MKYAGLTGKGFIVLEAPNYQLNEHEDISDAQGEAAMQAGRVGRSIIYAPVAIVTPQMNVNIQTPAFTKNLKALLGGQEVTEPEAKKE
jgi:hypothetical protein